MVMSRIKGLSEARRLPRLGKIRLGIKKVSPKSGKEYPVAVDYFVCPPEVKEVFGEQPKALPIMFPIEDETKFFSQNYKRYGSSTLLKCKGDGMGALEVTQKGLIERECLGEDCPERRARECNRVGVIQFLLPDVPGAGVWQITTSSVNSIINLNSGIDYIRALCGRIAMIPLTLKIEPQDVAPDGKRKTVHVLALDMKIKLADLQRAALIEPTRCMLSLPEAEMEEPLDAEIEPQAEPVPEEKLEPEPPPEEKEPPIPKPDKVKKPKKGQTSPDPAPAPDRNDGKKSGLLNGERENSKKEIQRLIMKIVKQDVTKVSAKFKEISGFDKFNDVPDGEVFAVVKKARVAYATCMDSGCRQNNQQEENDENKSEKAE